MNCLKVIKTQIEIGINIINEKFNSMNIFGVRENINFFNKFKIKKNQ